MSFFNSLQQMVSSGVANLSLSPKRFSFSKESSTGSEEEPTPGPSPGGRSASMPGMPRVLPPPGGPAPTRRKTLAESPRKHHGSFKQRQPLAFCRRRLSWPEVDQQATSGVQETDGSFFESYTAVSWKLENRRLMTIQEGGPPSPPPPPQTVGVKPPPELRIHHKELEQLYIEVMYTITNKVGASSGQFTHYQEDLYSYAQKAFGVTNEQHRKYLSIASEEKPPIVVLNVVVMEAEGLEAKDANGYSDPYCMLSVMPCEMIPQETDEESQATLRSPIALIASTIGL